MSRAVFCSPLFSKAGGHLDSPSLSTPLSQKRPARSLHLPGNRVIALLLFLFVLIAQTQFPIHQTVGDAVWNLPTAFSLVYEGNIDLKEYQTLIDQFPNLGYTLHDVNNTPYNTYPVGASLFAVPFVAVAGWISNTFQSVDLHALSQQMILINLDMLIACVTVAATAALLYLIARLYLANAPALLIAMIFAFGTTALSVASRGLWQHGPSMLMLTITLCALLRAQRSPAFLTLAGFTLAFAYIIRPTNSVSVIVLTLYVLLRFRLQIIRFIVGALLISLPFFYLNITVYGQVFAPYFVSYFLPSLSVGGWLEALLGNLVSPSRGLFIFSSVLLFSLVGIGFKVRKRSMNGLDTALVLILVLHWMLMSLYLNWWAGYSFGPRYMTDVLPYFAFFLIPVFADLPSLSRLRFWLVTTLLAITIFASVAIHFRGSSEVATQTWNSVPVSVDEAPGRVWDWTDVQFLRGIGEPNASIDLGAVSAHRFEFDADSLAYEDGGWGDAEHFEDGTTFQWMLKKQASLTIRLASRTDLQVEIGILRAVSPELLANFSFSVNGVPIGLRVDQGVYSGYIPAAALSANGKPTTLQFTVDHVVSPQSLGENGDSRTLGLMLDYLDIKAIQ